MSEDLFSSGSPIIRCSGRTKKKCNRYIFEKTLESQFHDFALTVKKALKDRKSSCASDDKCLKFYKCELHNWRTKMQENEIHDPSVAVKITNLLRTIECIESMNNNNNESRAESGVQRTQSSSCSDPKKLKNIPMGDGRRESCDLAASHQLSQLSLDNFDIMCLTNLNFVDESADSGIAIGTKHVKNPIAVQPNVSPASTNYGNLDYLHTYASKTHVDRNKRNTGALQDITNQLNESKFSKKIKTNPNKKKCNLKRNKRKKLFTNSRTSFTTVPVVPLETPKNVSQSLLDEDTIDLTIDDMADINDFHDLTLDEETLEMCKKKARIDDVTQTTAEATTNDMDPPVQGLPEPNSIQTDEICKTSDVFDSDTETMRFDMKVDGINQRMQNLDFDEPFDEVEYASIMDSIKEIKIEFEAKLLKEIAEYKKKKADEANINLKSTETPLELINPFEYTRQNVGTKNGERVEEQTTSKNMENMEIMKLKQFNVLLDHSYFRIPSPPISDEDEEVDTKHTIPDWTTLFSESD